jgi:very-short-patch-repair endonuclease
MPVMSIPTGPVRGHRRTRAWTRVSHGLHTPTAAPEPLAAWQLVLPPSGAFTGITAAREHGWWLPLLPEETPVFAAVPESAGRIRRDGLRVSRHREQLPFVTVRGLLDVVVLVDAALHLESCSRSDVEAVLGGRRKGGPRLSRALALADARSESAWESVLRMLHVACGIPVEPQFVVTDRHGDFVARGDLRVGETRTLHEYDGGEHRLQPRHRADLRRERALGNAGWTRRGYTAAEVTGQGMVILREADQTLGRRHDPRRLRAWSAMLGESTYSPRGRTLLRRRWGLP